MGDRRGQVGDLPRLVARHPELRAELPGRIFWKAEHGWLLLAALGVACSRRSPVALGLVAPWAISHRSARQGLRGRVRDLIELPGAAAIDLAELLAMVRGSARHRALLL